MSEKQRLPPVSSVVYQPDPIERARQEEINRRFERLVALDPSTATVAQVLKALTGQDT